MARTRHQTVVSVRGGRGSSRTAKNANLKQAAHKGAAPVTDPRSAQSGYAAVPVSTATMPPGEGPPMSSASPSVARSSRNSRAKNSTSKGPISKTAATPSAQTTLGPSAVVAQGGGRGKKTAAKSRSRAKRKR